jgi:predicted branched-subunit amino acid permease
MNVAFWVAWFFASGAFFVGHFDGRALDVLFPALLLALLVLKLEKWR